MTNREFKNWRTSWGFSQGKLAKALGVDAGQVSVKAKTGEGVDALGRGEAVRADAVALISKIRP